MFYSETLLAKNGPLARVWLASNLERKLSKQNVLSEKLDEKVQDIIGTGQAPIALRLSGQLLLGVVRIYSRKARYLLDDCSEALVKIKMAFCPGGNVDLPLHQQGGAGRAGAEALVLPETITDLDLFAPLPDPDELLREPEGDRTLPGRDPTLLDFGASQLLPESQTPRGQKQERRMLLEEDDLGLDLGLEPREQAVRSTPAPGGEETERSIEVGRRAQTPRRDEPSLLLEDDLGLDIGGFGDTTAGRESSIRPPMDDNMPMLGADDDIPMGGVEPQDDEVAKQNEAAFNRVDAEVERRQRASESPLSDADLDQMNDLERTFHLSQIQGQEAEDEDHTVVRAAQRAKRRRVMKQDAETELHNSQIRKQQEDRSGITKAPSFLPRDPLLLQLMEMQRNGTFVSNIMGDGSMAGWAPELRGILSLELVRDRKRKRDSGIADVETGDERQPTPQLEIPALEEDEGLPTDAGAVAADFGGDTTLGGDIAAPLPMSEGPQPEADVSAQHQGGAEEEEDLGLGFEPSAPFDTTEAPLLHPSQTGPVALGTKNAVHALREHFAPSHPADATEPPSPSKRTKTECLFTDLCPEARTHRGEATKMFFEMLVLGTKDAVKVEQESGEVGLPIRVRGKRGLWGDWAERGAGGEIEGQSGEEAAGSAAVEV